MKKVHYILVLVMLVLSACGTPAETPAPVTSVATEAPTATAVSTEPPQPVITFVNNSLATLSVLWVKDASNSEFEKMGVLDATNTILEVTTNPGDAFIVSESIDEWKGHRILDYVATEDGQQTVTIEADTIRQALLRDGLFTISIGFANHTDQPAKILWWDDATQTYYPQGIVQPGGQQFIAADLNEKFLAIDLNDNVLAEYTATDDVAQTFDIGANPEALAALEDKLKSDLNTLKNDGYISSTEGVFKPLADHSEDYNEMAADTNFQYEPLEDFTELENFVYTAHFKWATAVESLELNGCGVMFGYQQEPGDRQGEHFAIFLGRSGVGLYISQSNNWLESNWLSATSSPGSVNFGNPAEADFTLVINGYKSYVFVDNKFIAEYDLPTTRSVAGKFMQSMGTSIADGYGVHCEISNAAVWSLNP
jgi:hypothetical protein